MKFISTRQGSKALSFEEVILQGLAPDGGLYLPESLPFFNEEELLRMSKLNYRELFFEVTKNFVLPSICESDYKKIIENSYGKNFTHPAIAPLKQLSSRHFLLELFHGPTLAFKDFALQFLGNLLDFVLQKSGKEIVIIGATSGDTGSAAIHGCKSCQSAKIFILHPHQKVSKVQRKQMTTILDKNVFNIAVKGNFDDCQNAVKKMFANEGFLKGKKIVAVNSINFARVMAQIVYYFYAGLRLGASDSSPVSFSVPSANFGDIYAGSLAKRMGLPINKLIIATNENDILYRFLHSNDYSKHDMAETISPSMNIQVSSNFERALFDLYKDEGREMRIKELMKEFESTGAFRVEDSIIEKAKNIFEAYRIDDKTTKETIGEFYQSTFEILDPHSAIGVKAAENFIANNQNYKGEIVITLATAHPAKFPEALDGTGAPQAKLPRFLEDLMDREERYVVMERDLGKLKEFIAENSEGDSSI